MKRFLLLISLFLAPMAFTGCGPSSSDADEANKSGDAVEAKKIGTDRMQELQARKTNGTITPDEQEELGEIYGELIAQADIDSQFGQGKGKFGKGGKFKGF